MIHDNYLTLDFTLRDVEVNEQFPSLWVSFYILFITLGLHLNKELKHPEFNLVNMYTEEEFIDLHRLIKYQVSLQDDNIVIKKTNTHQEGYASACFCNVDYQFEE